jgi:hypothetical protein
MTDRYSIRHEEQKAARDADQAEWLALWTGSAVVDAGVRDDLIAEALEVDELEPGLSGLEDADPGRERWHRQDLGVEAEVGAVHQEATRRCKYLGKAYPFDIDGGTLTYRGPSSGLYEYLLGISVAPNVTTGEYVCLPRSFERVIATVTKLYMGAHSEAFHCGHPRDPGYGTWKSAMVELHNRSREWWWSPEDGYPDEPHVGGDGGIDFVVWKRALDARPGSLFIAGQCACGGDWDDKLDDLSLKELGGWFHPISWIEPIRAFATPFALSDGNFQKAHKRAGWVLDRVRLSAMAEPIKDEAEYTDWLPVISQMVDLALPAVA